MSAPIDMPMNTANHHAAVAEEYQASGLIVLAAEEHQGAADALLAAIERSNDESAKRTLRLLYNRHCKDRDELHRRIQKLRDEGKDPNLPQRPDAAPPYRNQRHNSSAEAPSHAQSSTNSNSQQIYSRRMSDSHMQNTVDESFMVLGGQRSDPGDAFNQFWNALQGMLDNISQPVAFATAPLGNLDIPTDTGTQSGSQTPPSSQHVYGGIQRDHSATLDSDDDRLLSKWTKKIGISRQGSRRQTPPSSSFHDEFDEDEFLEEGDDLSGSFFLIPSGSEPSTTALRKENAKLKAELSSMEERLKATEHMLKLRKEQDMQLRNSIFEAQRAMSASGILPRQPGGDMNAMLSFSKTPAVPIAPLKPSREAQYTKRIKELEDEIRTVRAENEKNKLMITKFRERWEKLKESAKRKKEAKAAESAHSTNVRGQKIVEEPEAEEELDGTNG